MEVCSPLVVASSVGSVFRSSVIVWWSLVFYFVILFEGETEGLTEQEEEMDDVNSGE